ncbi:NUDIX domain-containing protein [Haloferax sp. DFSO52]|uniref:NUDIX domain-containing protein n=1 Tax=Haloferax sp. DFSO52 TaxID=3388505 RepID=UPI003A870694
MTGARISARALVVDDDHLLTVQYGDGDENWYLTPGGRQELGEPLSETVRREVSEETGYDVAVESLAFVRDFVPSNHVEDGSDDAHRVDHFFWCELVDDEPTAPTIEDSKQVGVEWLSVDELDESWFFPRELVGPLHEQVTRGNREARYVGDIP